MLTANPLKSEMVGRVRAWGCWGHYTTHPAGLVFPPFKQLLLQHQPRDCHSVIASGSGIQKQVCRCFRLVCSFWGLGRSGSPQVVEGGAKTCADEVFAEVPHCPPDIDRQPNSHQACQLRLEVSGGIFLSCFTVEVGRTYLIGIIQRVLFNRL